MNAGAPGRGLTAVILAAGIGRRINETALPKPLLPLTGDDVGPNFLERHVDVLTGLGVDNVVMVHSEAALDHFPAIPGSTVVVNPFDTSTTGSTLSLLCALRSDDVPPDHGLLVMDADIIYERELMRHVVEACGRSVLFVSPAIAGDDEEVRVYVDGTDAPVLIGKGLPPAMVSGMELLGESLGVIHVADHDREVVLATCEWLVGWPPDRPGFGYSKVRSEHEEVWQYMFSSGRMGASSSPSGLLFSECDTIEDYRTITNGLYEAIVERDRIQAEP